MLSCEYINKIHYLQINLLQIQLITITFKYIGYIEPQWLLIWIEACFPGFNTPFFVVYGFPLFLCFFHPLSSTLHLFLLLFRWFSLEITILLWPMSAIMIKYTVFLDGVHFSRCLYQPNNHNIPAYSLGHYPPLDNQSFSISNSHSVKMDYATFLWRALQII